MPITSPTPRTTTGRPGATTAAEVTRQASLLGIPRAWAWAVAAIPVIGLLILLALYAVWRPAFFDLTREDHLIEWTQVVLALTAMALATMAALRAVRDRHRVLAGLLGLCALTFLMMAGEEISWGQRVLALPTPEGLSAVNAQEELNLHNITALGGIDVQTVFQWGTVLVAALGVVLALVPPRRAPRGVLLHRVQPPLFAVPGLAFTVAYWVFVPAFGGLAPVARMQEWAEVCMLLSFTATALAAHLRAPGVPGTRQARRWPVIAGLVAVAATLVLAGFTDYHGIVPVNARSRASASGSGLRACGPGLGVHAASFLG